MCISFLSFFFARGYEIKIIRKVFNPLSKSLLFTNSGVAGIYEEFVTDTMKKTATIQQCVRIDGKHNDLEDVGKSNYHLTCFNMLGTFATNDVSLHIMIKDIYDFIRLYMGSEGYIYATVHSKDTLSKNVWTQILPHDRVVMDDNNVWQMSNEGYCGYCSEIRYVHNGEDIELWNIVVVDREVKRNCTNALPSIKVDTGGGLERLYAIFNDSLSVYADEQYNNYFGFMSRKCSNYDARIILDHIRTINAIVCSNIPVSNNKRGYVLKKLLRRLCYVMFRNNIKVSDIMYACSTYIASRYYISIILYNEYTSFVACINEFKKYVHKKSNMTLDRDDITKLHTTYGIHYQLCYILCDDMNIKYSKLNEKDIESISVKQRAIQHTLPYSETQFIDDTCSLVVNNICIMNDAYDVVDYIIRNTKYYITFRSTVFYPKSGGQDSDLGVIEDNDGHIIFTVTNVTYVGKAIVCVAIAQITCAASNISFYILKVDEYRRNKLSCLHSAHHVMLNLVSYIVKSHVYQCSSNIAYNGAKLSVFSYHYNYTSMQYMNYILDRIVKSGLSIMKYKNIYFNVASKNYIYLPDNYPDYVNVVSIRCNLGIILSQEVCCGTHNVSAINKIVLTKVRGAKTNHQSYYFDILVN